MNFCSCNILLCCVQVCRDTYAPSFHTNQLIAINFYHRSRHYVTHITSAGWQRCCFNLAEASPVITSSLALYKRKLRVAMVTDCIRHHTVLSCQVSWCHTHRYKKQNAMSRPWWGNMTCLVRASGYKWMSMGAKQTHTVHAKTQTQQSDSWAAFALRCSSLLIVLRLHLLTAELLTDMHGHNTCPHQQTHTDTDSEMTSGLKQQSSGQYDHLLMAQYSKLKGSPFNSAVTYCIGCMYKGMQTCKKI